MPILCTNNDGFRSAHRISYFGWLSDTVGGHFRLLGDTLVTLCDSRKSSRQVVSASLVSGKKLDDLLGFLVGYTHISHSGPRCELIGIGDVLG